MEKKESTTQQRKSPSSENLESAEKNDNKPVSTTPTASSAWTSSWGGWLSQAKEKVIFIIKVIQIINFI